MADGGGIALNEQMMTMTVGLQEKLTADNFATAENTPKLGEIKKFARC